MAPSTPDQSALLKEVLEAIKALQLNQAQLTSNVDAISGRVNVLAGMKEVRDVAAEPSVKKVEPRSSAEEHLQHDDVVPESPSLPATQIEGDGRSTPSLISHTKKPSTGTSRIILT
jgi:hypothetical protein